MASYLECLLVMIALCVMLLIVAAYRLNVLSESGISACKLCFFLVHGEKHETREGNESEITMI
jgi:hypothetical protein